MTDLHTETPCPFAFVYAVIGSTWHNNQSRVLVWTERSPYQLVDAEVGMRAVGEADGAGRPADLLHGDAVVHVPQAHPAVLLRRGEAVEVEVPHELPQVDALGEMVGGVDRRGVRRDGLLRELVHALLELVRGRTASERASEQSGKGK